MGEFLEDVLKIVLFYKESSLVYIGTLYNASIRRVVAKIKSFYMGNLHFTNKSIIYRFCFVKNLLLNTAIFREN